MDPIKIGDIVGRKSYNCDIFFKVIDIGPRPDGKDWAYIKGLDLRLCADAPVEDLQRIGKTQISNYLRESMIKNAEHMRRIFMRRSKERQLMLKRAAGTVIDSFDVPGSVLHLDGDKEYLDLCLTSYRQLGIPVKGAHVKESEQAGVLADLLPEYNPDILVLTGHDGLVNKNTIDFSDINTYRSSKHFVESVKVARKYEKSKDDLVIFAGACQSHYEAILAAGANFASSPQRVLIHAFDPVFVVEKISYTSIYSPISIKDVIENTITGFDGIGGLETRGKYRMGIPRSPY